ncbi:MAG: hypothetical protein IJ285_00910 [Clostridia bacterium]|nr:hypothetical protein [Clostridia bacterium]
MKAVLISIQPKWCELIASGKKTVEVRKTRPKIETPFKCYIYCTHGKTVDDILTFAEYKNGKYMGDYYANGKVIGEFICDDIITDKTFGHNALFKTSACMSDADVSAYCLNKEMYCWHISDLVIYEQPKELIEFSYPCKNDCDTCKYNRLNSWANTTEPVMMCQRYVPNAPQSWCYVAELKGGER